jgi:hypothetical protein
VEFLLQGRVATGVGLVLTVLAIAVRLYKTRRWELDMSATINAFVGATSAPVALGLMLASMAKKMPPADIKLYLAVSGLALAFMTVSAVKQFFFVVSPAVGDGVVKKEEVKP